VEVRLRADLCEVRLKPDATYYIPLKIAAARILGIADVGTKAGRSQGSRKRKTRVDLHHGSVRPNPQRSGAADPVFDQIEYHRIADDEVVERCTLAHIASVKPDFSTVRRADRAMALTGVQPDNVSAIRHADRLAGQTV